MGAWGPGSFENDDALDWVHDFMNAEDDSILESSLSLEVDEPTGVEGVEWAVTTPWSCSALAAAEVVAALHGRPCQGLPEEIAGWVREADGWRPPDELTAMALETARRILSDSELAELWEDNPEWLDCMNDLIRRLAGQPSQ